MAMSEPTPPTRRHWFQFGIGTMLLAITFIAITLGGAIAAVGICDADYHIGPQGVAEILAYWAALWLPFPFATYAAGRRKLTVTLVAMLGVAEAAACGMMYVLQRWWLES
jgi:hypothetical protein